MSASEEHPGAEPEEHRLTESEEHYLGKPNRHSWSSLFTAAFLVLLTVFGLCMFVSAVFAWNEVSQVRERLDQTIKDRELDEDQEDCRLLYSGDLVTALGTSQLANNNMWITVGARSADVSEEEAIADNNRLAAELAESNEPLESAVVALTEYDALQPRPAKCPHPEWSEPYRFTDEVPD